MPRTFVGETRLPKNFKRYARQFSLLELDSEPGSVPGKGRLEACAAAAPDGFVFSLVVPSRLASLESGPEADKAWKHAQSVARRLGGKASWWVVRTPAEVRPTRRSRESLAALAARLKEGGVRVAWEPRGVWDESAAGDFAESIGVTLIQDVAREVPRPGPVLYSRLLALGKGGRVGLSLADLIAERMHAHEEAFVVVEGQGAREIQQALGLGAGADEDLLDADAAGAAEADAGASAEGEDADEADFDDEAEDGDVDDEEDADDDADDLDDEDEDEDV
jgi:uncharacterized protein YecE (DUF72 family)